MIRRFPEMKRRFGLCTVLFFSSFTTQVVQPVLAAGSDSFGVQMSYETSAEPLTTEKVWVVDPDEWNPHRAMWVLQRQVLPLQWAVRPRPSEKGGRRPQEPKASSSGSFLDEKNARFGVEIFGISAVTRGWVRAESDARFRASREVACAPNGKSSGVSSPDGAGQALERARVEWEALLQSEAQRLRGLLRQVVAPQEKLALERGKAVFDSWHTQLEQRWRTEQKSKVRDAEWDYYQRLLKANAWDCEKTPARKVFFSASEAGARPPIGMASPTPSAPLVRAPARRWDGLMSVRLNSTLGNTRLNGQFLLDSGIRKSVVSTEWLEGQGFPPSTVLMPFVSVEKVGAGYGPRFARSVRLEQVDLSGFPLRAREFWAFDTSYFYAPNFAHSCCDGVLGLDFFRDHVVEFLPGKPAAIQIHAKDGYQDPDLFWIETVLTPKGEVVSDCRIEGMKGFGVRWLTSQKAPGIPHEPWAAQVRSQDGTEGGDLFCWGFHSGSPVRSGIEREVAQVKIAAKLPFAPASGERERLRLPENPLVETPVDDVRSDFRKAALPAWDVGMSVLSRGRFVLDLPHGRIGLDPRAFEKPLLSNQSGLELVFIQDGMDRVLRVRSIRAKSPAARLNKLGLKAGVRIFNINGVAADEVDLWQVEELLAGREGPEVKLEIAQPGAPRMKRPRDQKMSELTLKVR
jgi:hypothetical protein